MLARILHIACSLWLAALLLFGSTPASAIHQLARHHDTVHHHSDRGLLVETQHHHCQFLSFELMPFDGPRPLPAIAALPLRPRHHFIPAPDERASQQATALREGRGPPAVC
jgi:hypothetical protein